MSRIGSVPPEIVERNADRGLALISHELSESETERFSVALGALTPLHKAILQDHLRSISFVEGLPANGQTVRVDPSGPEQAFDLVFNARILGETVSEFATRKERELFDVGESTLHVSVSAGSMDAVVFVLLHEATHIVDMVVGLRYEIRGQEAVPTPLIRGVWDDALTPVSEYRGELLSNIPQRTGGEPLDIERAQALYEDLKRTPFASVYASLADIEDIAELVAWWQMTVKYGQPYSIEIRDGDTVIYSHEPMASPLVQNRLDQLRRFESSDSPF
jgi:hypothetical protein